MEPAYFFDERTGKWLYGNGQSAMYFDEATGDWMAAGPEDLAVLRTNGWDSARAESNATGDGGSGMSLHDGGGAADPPPGGGGDHMGEWGTNYGTGGRNVVTPFSTNSVDQMAEQNRLASRDWWNILDQDTRDAGNLYQNAEQNFLRRGMASYDPVFRGQGGFSQPEQGNLIQQDRILGGMATNEDLANADMADWERDMILGNPWGGIDEAKNQLSNTRGDLNTSADKIRGVSGNYGRQLGEYIDPNRLRQSDTYDPTMQSYIDDAADSYSQVIDPRILGLSEDFNNNYNWTGRDTQDLMDKAGRTVANRGAANRDYIERTAAQSGNYSPEALAAGFSRSRVDEDTSAARAILDARMAGRGRELDITKDREGMRLDTERDYTSRMTDAIKDITGQRLGHGTTAEQMRLGAEQGLSDRQVGAAGDAAQMEMQGEQNIGGAYQDLGKYGTGVAYDAARYGNDAMARGGQQAYQNRLGAGQAGIATRFGQALDSANALRSGFNTVYGQKKAEEAEGRGFLTGQQNVASNNAQAVRGQRMGAAGTGIGGINDATNLALGTKYLPTAMDKGIGLAIGALGAGAKIKGGG